MFQEKGSHKPDYNKQFRMTPCEIFLRIDSFRTGTSSMKDALAQLLPGRCIAFFLQFFSFPPFVEVAHFSFFSLLFNSGKFLTFSFSPFCSIWSSFSLSPFLPSLQFWEVSHFRFFSLLFNSEKFLTLAFSLFSSILRSGTNIDFRFLHFLVPLL